MRSLKIMFNEEQKQEYIIYENANEQALTNYFKRISGKERKYEKDIADMNYDEVNETLTSLNIRREATRAHIISLLRGYANWAKINGKAKGDGLEKINTENTADRRVIRSQMIGSPKHLESILSSTLDDVNYENRAKRDSLVFWLLYSGFGLGDLQTLKKDSLNTDTGIVTSTKGEQIKVCDKVVKLWNDCTKITYIERKNGKSSTDEYTRSNLINNDYLFREICGKKYKDWSKPCSEIFLRNIITKVINEYTSNKKDIMKLPPENIKYSGKFYNILMLEKNNIEITPSIFAEQFKIKNNSTTTDLLLKTRKWRIDYDDWRLAFGYGIIFGEE